MNSRHFLSAPLLTCANAACLGFSVNVLAPFYFRFEAPKTASAVLKLRLASIPPILKRKEVMLYCNANRDVATRTQTQECMVKTCDCITCSTTMAHTSILLNPI